MKNVIHNGRELTATEERAQEAAIERVRDDVHHGRPERHAAMPVDDQDLREAQSDILQGKDARADIWRQVMEHYHFVWLEPKQLDELIGPERYIPSRLQELRDAFGREVVNSNLYWTRPHAEGQWRYVPSANKHPHPALRTYAFTIKDLVGMYTNPEAFDDWAKLMIRRWKKTRGKIRRRG